MKRLAIVVPVRAPLEGKSRLAGILSADERYELNLKLMRHTFDQVAVLAEVAAVYVVSKSSEVLADAARRGFEACSEPDDCELNGAVTLAARWAEEAGAIEVMVLPTDLPWLSSDQLLLVLEEFRDTCDVMIVTDRTKLGTNLLLWRPIGTSNFSYGVGSAKQHAEAAARLNLRVRIRQDRLLSFDLDTPYDFEVWSRSASGGSQDAEVGEVGSRKGHR
jgi:2-phospho-L-lactate/phosphoenolpyruvate guanylyltransferase